MNKNKKGDMSVKAIIGWIVLILSFVIILVFVLVYPWGSNLNADTCHTTIVLRASANLGKLNGAQGDIPLKCQTQKICLKSGLFGSCPSFGKASVTNMPGATKQEVVNSIAETIYSDFSMTGKGLLNFLPRGFTSNKYCLITSRIAVDPKAEIDSISNFDIYQQLSQTKNSNGISNLKEMYGLDNPDQMQAFFGALAKVDSRFSNSTQFLQSKLNLSNDQDVIVVIIKKGWWKAVSGGVVAGAVVATGIALTPITLGASLATVAVVGTFGATAYTFGPADTDYEYHPPILVEDTPEALKELNCDSIETLA